MGNRAVRPQVNSNGPLAHGRLENVETYHVACRFTHANLYEG